MNEVRKVCCANCVFANQIEGGIECRRYPPRVIPDTVGEVETGEYSDKVHGSTWTNPLTCWPIVIEHQWCGEFKPKDGAA